MARKAIAATLAAIVLLTVLVVADATVMSAQDDLASSAQVSQLESREHLLEQTLAASSSLQLLAQVQEYLSSSPAQCDGLSQYAATISAASSASGEDSGVAYVVNATASGASSAFTPALGDNLTMVAPFAGAVAGALNLKETLRVKEVGVSVSLNRRETHILNIPIDLDSASSLCGSALGTIASALSQSQCNATLKGSAFLAVLPGVVEEASARGFALTAGWSPSGACSASYWVTLVQPGVAGPTGGFDWTVHGSGTTA